VYYTSIASIITPGYFKTCLSRRPTFRPSASWSQPESSVGRCCQPCKGHCWRIHVGMWVAGRCFGVKLWKSRNYLRYFGSFNLFAVNTHFVFRWVNCVVVYLLFSRYISCSNFWHVSSIHVPAIDFRRGRAHSSVRSIALHTVCGVSIECLEWIVWIVLYIPFTHSSLNTIQKIGVWE